MIPYNIPCVTGQEKDRIHQVLETGKFSGDGEFTRMCHAWFNSKFTQSRTLLTTSGTHSLEMAVILAGIGPGDEVIMPSYTFTSTATAVVIRGGVPVFIDIRPDTMNMDESLIEKAVTDRTRAIIAVHYAGIACEMDSIVDIAHKYGLFVIEDAAQSILSTYKGKYLGTMGDFGCFSFHETKNIQCGEGGATVVNNLEYQERAEIIREKGTNRSQFWRGEIDKYTWIDTGSSYLPSELNAAFLSAQLEEAEKIILKRQQDWDKYYKGLSNLSDQGFITLPCVPEECTGNGHIFYIKLKDSETRSELIRYLKNRDIMSVFHYIPLHSSHAGMRFGRFHGKDIYTTTESEKLLRLPMYYSITDDDLNYVIESIESFYKISQ